MPCIHFGSGKFTGIVTVAGDYKPGDQPPAGGGYLETSEWAEVQMKAGLKQSQCGSCCKWYFPQELSDQVLRSTAIAKKRGQPPREVEVVAPLCHGCAGTKPTMRRRRARR